jgi:glycosyltransferase involved in cell wall biosynthesis
VSRTVDVIVPCYNYGRYLEASIRSLLDQPGVSVRVLVIDDHSSDDSAAVARRLAAADPRVTVRIHASNIGHIATYNEGFAWASADYVLLISADDLLTPGALGRAVDALEAHPAAAFAYGRQVVFGETPVLADEPAAASAGVIVSSGAEFIRRACTTAENSVPTPTVVVRTALQHRAGSYTASLPHTADLEMWLRLAALGSVIQLQARQAFKRRHDSNMQNAYLQQPFGDVRELAQAFDSFLDGAGRTMPDAAALGRAVHAQLAVRALYRAVAVFDAGMPDEADDLLAMATGFDPGIRRHRKWRSMAIKRQLGPRVWRLLAPAIRLVRLAAMPRATARPAVSQQ